MARNHYKTWEKDLNGPLTELVRQSKKRKRTLFATAYPRGRISVRVKVKVGVSLTLTLNLTLALTLTLTLTLTLALTLTLVQSITLTLPLTLTLTLNRTLTLFPTLNPDGFQSILFINGTESIFVTPEFTLLDPLRTPFGGIFSSIVKIWTEFLRGLF